MPNPRTGPRFTHRSLVVLALDQVSAAGVLVAYLRAGHALVDQDAGRMVSGRSVDEWRELEERRRQRFIATANRILMCVSGHVPIYDVVEAHGRVWRYVGLDADQEYVRLFPEEDDMK
jgi:hypothetical protein